MLLLLVGLAAGAAAQRLPPPIPGWAFACLKEREGKSDSPYYADLQGGLDSNRIEMIRAFLAQHPESACVPFAQQYLDQRAYEAARMAAMPKIPAPKPVSRVYLASVITPDDYPPDAIRYQEEGVVEAVWDVEPDGYVENCRIKISSNSEILDRATCRILTRRVRYYPARDADGNPIVSADHVRINWRIPADKRVATPPPHLPSPH